MTRIIPGPRTGATVASLGFAATSYYPITTPGNDTTLTLVQDRPYVGIFPVTATRTFDRIALEVTTQASAGGVLRLGIYNNSNGHPSTVLLDAGTVASTTTGVKAITISQSLPTGYYWLAVIAQVATCTVVSRTGPAWGVSTTSGGSGNGSGLSGDTNTGALVTWTGAVGLYEQNFPKIMVRAA